jgi:hypothetical protein
LKASIRGAYDDPGLELTLFMNDKHLSDKKLELRLLYRGHSMLELSLLSGVLESERIEFLQKRDAGLAEMAPSVFFSPLLEVQIYVAAADWVKAEALAQLVLGEDWQPPQVDNEGSTP